MDNVPVVLSIPLPAQGTFRGLQLLEHFREIAIPGCLGMPAPAAPEFPYPIRHHRAQPGAKTPLAAMTKAAHVPQDRGQGLLDQILAIGRLESESRQPVIQQRAVQVDEIPPGGFVGVVLHSFQKAERCIVHPTVHTR